MAKTDAARDELHDKARSSGKESHNDDVIGNDDVQPECLRVKRVGGQP